MTIVKALVEAESNGRALAAFNAATLEAMVAVGHASRTAGQPAIIQTSSKLVSRYSPAFLKALFDAAMARTGGQCYLHLDHCDDLEIISACVDAGWDMVMFDGSHLPISENCRLTKQVVDIAHAGGTAVEAEVGAIGGEEDGREAVANYARADDIQAITENTGIDCIAVGFGNVHGRYADKSALDWAIFEGARDITSLPLVLHGGSGLTNDEFARAIRAGAAKVNISTDLKETYAATVSGDLLTPAILKDPSVIHDTLVDRLSEVALQCIKLFADLDHIKKETSCNS